MFKIKNLFSFRQEISSDTLIILIALFLIAFGNDTFFTHVIEVYPVNWNNIGFLITLTFGFTGVIVILFSLVCHRLTFKPIVISILLISSFTAYFMDSYNTVIDDSMIENVMHTDLAESLDLLSPELIAYVLLLGILPSCFVYKSRILFKTGWKQFFSRVKLVGFILLTIFAVVFIYSDFYSSFFREHKPLRYYANPSYYVFSTGKYIGGLSKASAMPLKNIGLDAKTSKRDPDRELVIVVVGETARADRFSLNGYSKETNPLLAKEQVISFSNFWSCGTSTATSVPCMFSNVTMSDYESETVKSTENALDVLQREGVNVLWLDNNSDSKGVAVRVPYQSFKSSDTNPVCDSECRDIGMLKNLQHYIDEHPKGDIVIVLHQMGNHGPAYYKRYPAEFEKFTPVCKTNQLEECNQEEINNAYDNAILYTDYFLSNVIKLLKQNDSHFETAMFYVSDHGESLGENGLYLHGLPRFIAPDTQTHVPAIFWFGSGFHGTDRDLFANKQNAKFGHDNIFHTLLGFVETESKAYDPEMDLLHN